MARAGGDHVAGFAEYERRMRAFVATNQKMGRDYAARSSPNSRFALVRPLLRAVNDIELPDYAELAVS